MQPTVLASTASLKHRGTRIVALTLAVLLLWMPAAGAKTFDAAAVKAVFLFRLALFVTWPEPQAPSADTPFVIGILGKDPFDGRMEAVVAGETIGAQKITVHRYVSLADIAEHPCQLLYVGEIGAAERSTLQDLSQRHKILTVGETPNFAKQGGMMAIETVSKRIRITINLMSTRRAGFSISAKLLKVAELIQSDGP